MLQTKFAVFYRKLCTNVKFGDSHFDSKNICRAISYGARGWVKVRSKRSSLLLESVRQRLREEERCCGGGGGVVGVGGGGGGDEVRLFFNGKYRFHMRKSATLQHCSAEIRKRLQGWEVAGFKRSFGSLFSTKSEGMITLKCPASASSRSSEDRKKSGWIGDEMRSEMRKQAPGTARSSADSYEAGKSASKEKSCPSPCYSETKEKSHGKDSALKCPSPCPPEKKQICVREVEPILPPPKCPPEENFSCEDDTPPPRAGISTCEDHLVVKKKRRPSTASSDCSEVSKKKYGFPASSSAAASSASSRASKQCAPVAPAPSKRTPANALARSRSSSAPPPQGQGGSQKCPPSGGAVACRKPCVPCTPPSPPPSPPAPSGPPAPICPAPPNPPPKTRCASPQCQPQSQPQPQGPPCPPAPCPPPCPPPPPPPCCPPPAQASTPKMEALQYDPGSKALNFYMLNAPTSIRKDEVLVQVVYSGVCGSDLTILEGKGPAKNNPIILGHEFSGIACAVGSGVSHVKCGDCIAIDPFTSCHVCRYCARGQFGACLSEGMNNMIGVHKDGGWAEFVVVHKNQVHGVPPCLNLGQAALIKPLSCVMSGMARLNIPFGCDIVIQGTGVSGCLWASILHLQGHKNVIACDASEYKRKLFQCLDLKYCILPPEKMNDVKADIVIDTTGAGKSIERGIKMLNTQGQLLIFGVPSGDDELCFSPVEIAQKELRITAAVTNANNFAAALTLAEMMGCRYLDYEKLGIQTFKLGQFEGALKMKRSGEISKVVFKIQNSKS